MRQRKQDRPVDVDPASTAGVDSPTIQRLIEQLDRDLEDTERKALKAQ